MPQLLMTGARRIADAKPKSQPALVETLEQLKGTITMVIVSHREAPMVLCDTVLAFDEGRVTEIVSVTSDTRKASLP